MSLNSPHVDGGNRDSGSNANPSDCSSDVQVVEARRSPYQQPTPNLSNQELKRMAISYKGACLPGLPYQGYEWFNQEYIEFLPGVCSQGRWLHVCQTWVQGSHSSIPTLHAAALKLLTLPTLRSIWSPSLKILGFLFTLDQFQSVPTWETVGLLSQVHTVLKIEFSVRQRLFLSPSWKVVSFLWFLVEHS